jgi:hypothetical protein
LNAYQKNKRPPPARNPDYRRHFIHDFLILSPLGGNLTDMQIRFFDQKNERTNKSKNKPSKVRHPSKTGFSIFRTIQNG